MWKKLNFHLPKGLQKVKFRRQARFFSRRPNFSVGLAVNFCQELATQLLLGGGRLAQLFFNPLYSPPQPPPLLALLDLRMLQGWLGMLARLSTVRGVSQCSQLADFWPHNSKFCPNSAANPDFPRKGFKTGA